MARAARINDPRLPEPVADSAEQKFGRVCIAGSAFTEPLLESVVSSAVADRDCVTPELGGSCQAPLEVDNPAIPQRGSMPAKPSRRG